MLRLLTIAFIASACSLFGGRAAAQELKYVTDFAGNTFSGTGQAPNGKWMQNVINAIDVAEDGTVVTASFWDENGRCTALYRDGDVNSKLLMQYNGKGGHGCWGWGTAAYSVAVLGESIFIVNEDGQLLRFSWKPGDLDSTEYVEQIDKVGKAVGMDARGNVLVIVGDKGRISVRSTKNLKETGGFDLPGATSVAIGTKGDLWLVVGTRIVHRSIDGKTLPGVIEDAGVPTGISIDTRTGQLIVCDNGKRQQVLFYDVSKENPKLVRTFGDEGGLSSGTPGLVTHNKLWGLRGAGTDKAGNLYVGLCIGPWQGFATTLKSFDQAGKLRWETQCHGFTDCYSFDPASDGTMLYGCEEIITYDPSKPPGKSWSLKAISVDPIITPNDPRMSEKKGATGIIQRVDGRRILATIGMYAGGYQLFSWKSEEDWIAQPVTSFSNPRGESWAWDFDSEGTVWCGDHAEGLVRWKFGGWDRNGMPKYQPSAPEKVQGIRGIGIARLRYLPESDTLIVSGNTDQKKTKAWGLIGAVMVRFDKATTGKPVQKWMVDMPVDDGGLHPKAFDVAGDYIFTTMVGSTKQKPALVSVWRLSDGGLVGTMSPGPEVG
ncbi:MAG: hypothetical protein HC898_03480, partial [Phycisphaerales bacterium]|nr:hypothetical protein [Phycisphaerales bacterium]